MGTPAFRLFSVLVLLLLLPCLSAGPLAAETVGTNEEDASSDLSVVSSDPGSDLEVPGSATVRHPLRKGPYLIYTGQNTEMKVLWQLAVTDSCAIEWGVDQPYGLGSAVTSEYGIDHQHSFTIVHLTPSTLYQYRVIAREDTFAGSFRTAPRGDATQIGFFACGDTRSYPADHDQVAAGMLSAYAAEPDLQSIVVSSGDLVSSGDNEDAWDTQFFDPSYTNIHTMLATLPYQSCRGNHEGSGAVYYKYFPYPYESPMYWSFDYGPAHFVFVDQYVSYAPGSAQYTWIENDLATTAKPWRFLVFHEPAWSADGGHENNTDAQNYLQPLCVEHNVAMTIAGHNHYYARAVVEGVQHVTTGGGGAPLYTPDLGYPYIVAGAEVHHFCIIKIDDVELSFAAISTAGDTIDQFTLTHAWTSVDEPAEAPGSYDVVLSDAFPNPFNPVTTIAFSIPEAAHVELDVVSPGGRIVRSLAAGEFPAGEHRVSWDGMDDGGLPVSSGVYFYRLKVDGRVLSKRMVLLK
jgi:hypothetical protein